MKTRKFFKSCLEPLVGTDAPGKSKRSGVNATQTDDYSLGSGGSGGDVIAGFLKISSPFGDRKFESSDGGFAKDSREKSGRSFSRAIKAVLFEKSLMRKFRKKGSSPSTSVPSTSTGSSPETDHKMTKLSKKKKGLSSKETWGGTDESFGGNTSDSSDTTSIFSSSTRASTSCTSSRSTSDRKVSSPRSVTNFIHRKQASLNEERERLVLRPPKPVKEPLSLKPARTVTTTTTVTKRYNSNVMYFIVLSVIALMFWGKTFAIVCTTAWLYMVPRSFLWVADSPEIDSDEVYWCSKIVKDRMSEETSRRLHGSWSTQVYES